MKHVPLILALAAVLPALAYNQQASKTDLATRQARPATFTSSYQHKPAVQAPARQRPERRHKAGIALRDALTGQLPAASSQRGDAKQRRAGAAESPRVVMAPGTAGAASFRGRMHIATGATLDEHGIIVAPAEGERKVYQRSGSSYINTDGLHTVDQSGQVQIVECEDGTYYIRNILCTYPTGTWVVGQREGNTLTVASRQPIYYNPQAGVTYSIRWGASDDWGGFSCYDDYADAFTFAIDDEAGTITLQSSSAQLFMGLFWDDDLAFAWHGDFETTWTYSGPFEPLAVTTVTPPAGMTTETWYTKSHTLTDGEPQSHRGNITVGFDGQDVYLKGMFADYPDGWMKGTIDGETVTFSGLQLQGSHEEDDVYAVGTDNSDLTDFVMTYDAEAQRLTSCGALLANASPTEVEALTWLSDITIQKTDPFAPIDELPYANGFDTIDDWDWFTVEDANADDHFWRYYEEQAVYSYNEAMAADDWLYTPAIRLEAGKFYQFSMNVKCSSESFPELVEVKVGQQPAAGAMTTTVIEPTTVDHEDLYPVSNKLVSVSETGYYHFGIHAISEADRASLKVDDILVEETVLTAPAAVSDLTVKADAENPIATLTFTAPTLNIGGETMTAPMSIDIMRDGMVITTLEDVAPGASITYVDDDASLSSGIHFYQVQCNNADGKGDMSESVSVYLSQVMSIPYVADFTQDAVGNQFTQIDANEDYYRWEWDGGIHATYSYNSNEAADDYLVSPALHLDAGKRYSIVVNAGSAGYPERFEVVLGREATVEGLNVKLIEDAVVEMEDAKDFEAIYTAPETGVYYVAVHCISDADMYELWINKVSIEYAPEPTAPAAPVLKVTPGAEGALSADITIEAPATSIDGNNLTANISTIELYRDGTLLTTFEDVAPGATINYTDTDIDEASSHSYQAIPYNADGVGAKSGILTVFVGPDAPDYIRGVKADDHLTKVVLTWEKTTSVGRNGGYVNTDDIEYVVYACEPGSTVLINEPVAIVKDNFCEIEMATDEGEQRYDCWWVAARNEAGESYLEEESAALLFVGKPYDLPVVEGFADGSFHYYCDYVGTPLIFGQSSDTDGTALALVSQEANGQVAFTSGKLNIKDAANPTLFFDAAGVGVSTLYVIGSNGGDEADILATADITNAYQPVKVPLVSLQAGNYAMLGVTAVIPNPTTFDFWTGEIETEGDALILDNIRVVDLYDNDLSAAISAPANVVAGRKTTVTATVTNWGEQPAKGYTVTICAGDEQLMKQEVSEELEPFTSRNFTAELATTVFDEDGERTISVLVEYAADQKADNNQAGTSITVKGTDALAPENLEALSQGDGVVELGWTAPTALAAAYTEEFDDEEAFPPFSLGDITPTEPYGAIAEWTLYDGNGLEVYSWNDPRIVYPDQYSASAWRPFNLAKAGFPEEMSQGHSGTQVMLSMCIVPENGVNTTDHWLISPQLSGIGQEISFWLRTITDQYGAESFEVLASKTDNKLESFELVESFMTDNMNWECYSATLPEGTKYFAIRHTSTDVFGIMVDDVTFQYISSVSSYNIYRDQQLVATVEGDVTTYSAAIDDLEPGTSCAFAVTAVYANGQESRPAIINIDILTSLSQISASGKPVDIYALDGKLVRQQATTLEGLNGVFVIEGRKVMVP